VFFVSLGSVSIPTPHHLSWLALQELEYLFPENKLVGVFFYMAVGDIVSHLYLTLSHWWLPLICF
jgi:hypothetical protein